MRRAGNLSRRDFLVTSMLAGGSVLFCSLSRSAGADEAIVPAAALNGWIRISPDNAVKVFSRTTELGQGAHTSLAAIVAEELELEVAAVSVEMAPVREAFMDRDRTLGYGTTAAYYVTWGSLSSRDMDANMRRMAATARVMLLQAAARAWGAPQADCRAAGGWIRHADGRALSYASLAPLAAGLPVPQGVEPRPRGQWRRLGRPHARADIPAKTDGSLVYGMDVRLDRMLVATIAQCPIFGGSLQSADRAAAERMPGVRKILDLGDAIAVIAADYWSATQALARMHPVWRPGPKSAGDSTRHAALLRKALRAPQHLYLPEGLTREEVLAAHERGLSAGPRRLEAIYEVPFLAHAPLEPMNATAQVRPDGAELWLPTQNQGMVRETVAEALGLPREKVIVNTTAVGGGFGRRTEVDYAIQAARIARHADGPVKLIWSREEDTSRGYFRPRAMLQLSAALDAQGEPTAFAFTAACPSIMDYSIERRNGAPQEEINEAGLANARDWPYAIPARRIALASIDLGVPVTWMRSVGSAASAFALECFLDEMAAAAHADPVDYRRRLLAHRPRESAVLERVVRQSGWADPPRANRHRGIALNCANGSVVAQVVELEVDASGGVRLHEIHCVVDCGKAFNPDAVAAQMEGGIIFGLTGALLGEITLQGGAVVQKNFDSYPLLTLAQTPEIHVTILDSDAPIGGVGEEGVPPVGPAVANALFAATGRRSRSMPLMRGGLHLLDAR